MLKDSITTYLCNTLDWVDFKLVDQICKEVSEIIDKQSVSSVISIKEGKVFDVFSPFNVIVNNYDSTEPNRVDNYGAYKEEVW